MPRKTGEEINELRLYDNISNSTIVLYYRTPTTKERTGYANEAIQRKRNRVVFRQAEARLKYGARILVGFRTGDFMKKVGDKWVPYASDEGSEHYDSSWKARLNEGAADLIELLAAHVFDVPAELEDVEDLDTPEITEDAEKN